MDITQILIAAGSIVGIVMVALVAVVPLLMDIPAPQTSTGRVRPGTVTRPTGGQPAKLHLPV